MSAYDGGPAFPIPGAVSHFGGEKFKDEAYAGMTLRDYFAAKAMQGFLAAEANPRVGTESEPYSRKYADYLALEAYALADAMLAAREAV